MSADYSPKTWNMGSLVRGDTRPATNFTLSNTTTTLTRVRAKVVNSAGTTVMTLDSDSSGFIINEASSPTWDFDMDAISAASTGNLVAGTYSQDIETTDSAGTVRTWTQGTWEILPQNTD